MKFLKSFSHAFNGIRHSSIYEINFRIHLFTTFAVVAAGFCFAISNSEWLAVITCCILVLSAEMFNTAIEVFCDCLVKESMPAIKIVKDVAAGAVLITAIGSTIIGIVIFLPKIIHQINL
jgi:diacylglycerol kinase